MALFMVDTSSWISCKPLIRTGFGGPGCENDWLGHVITYLQVKGCGGSGPKSIY